MNALEIHTATPPPLDGRQFIADGKVVMEDDFGVCIEPFAGRVYVDSGELRWSISGTFKICVRVHPEEIVHIHNWSPLPQVATLRIQEAA